ncbi:hypothetical protein ACGTJS_11525 [Faucicola mancuniensis]|uniref:hypothetical protein n=1 Tax=Faucicola mancuniensis TaxID=1309795 RepID=UPI0028EBAE06|nr:hypothetical protein [uncultured Moraxella sp.]
MLAIDLPMNVETSIVQIAKQQGVTAEFLVGNIVANYVQENTLQEKPFNFDLPTIQIMVNK